MTSIGTTTRVICWRWDPQRNYSASKIPFRKLCFIQMCNEITSYTACYSKAFGQVYRFLFLTTTDKDNNDTKGIPKICYKCLDVDPFSRMEACTLFHGVKKTWCFCFAKVSCSNAWTVVTCTQLSIVNAKCNNNYTEIDNSVNNSIHSSPEYLCSFHIISFTVGYNVWYCKIFFVIHMKTWNQLVCRYFKIWRSRYL